jgi:hypothetical protein
MESVYHIVTIRVNETSWEHVWRLRSRYIRTGYAKYTQAACINWLPKLSYFRIRFLLLVVLLSPEVLSHGTSLSIFMMLSLTCVEC